MKSASRGGPIKPTACRFTAGCGVKVPPLAFAADRTLFETREQTAFHTLMVDQMRRRLGHPERKTPPA